MEAKTTKGKSLPYSNIKPSQIKGFGKIREGSFEGVMGMFIIEFQDVEETYLIKADYILKHMEQGHRKSLELEYVRSFGVRLEIMRGKKVLLDIPDGLKSYIQYQ